jgi:hypothetical protein
MYRVSSKGSAQTGHDRSQITLNVQTCKCTEVDDCPHADTYKESSWAMLCELGLTPAPSRNSKYSCGNITADPRINLLYHGDLRGSMRDVMLTRNGKAGMKEKSTRFLKVSPTKTSTKSCTAVYPILRTLSQSCTTEVAKCLLGIE